MRLLNPCPGTLHQPSVSCQNMEIKILLLKFFFVVENFVHIAKYVFFLPLIDRINSCLNSKCLLLTQKEFSLTRMRRATSDSLRAIKTITIWFRTCLRVTKSPIKCSVYFSFFGEINGNLQEFDKIYSLNQIRLTAPFNLAVSRKIESRREQHSINLSLT